MQHFNTQETKLATRGCRSEDVLISPLMSLLALMIMLIGETLAPLKTGVELSSHVTSPSERHTQSLSELHGGGSI